MKNKISFFISAIFIASIALLSSCEDEKTYADLMVIHASPDAPGVDLLIDDVKKNSAPLTYPNNTGYLNLESGTINIKVNVAGTSTSVINGDLDMESDKNYSVFANGAVASISALVLEDDLTTPAAGKAHVRFVHLSPDAPAVDIAVAATGGRWYLAI